MGVPVVTVLVYVTDYTFMPMQGYYHRNHLGSSISTFTWCTINNQVKKLIVALIAVAI